ncbi:thioredoxin 1 [Paeniglutamicibacter sulfureus]|uniref:Thioredoxin n=2 Tax=Micrococcaceae TaxID=1268 RepID=A0ABU2BM95_9MICC|nr:thioredoxin 1 [Paeniglutamicibacter sulfureus]
MKTARESQKRGADCGDFGISRYRWYMATINITESEFTTTLDENDIVFVDFWAEWCGPCRQFAPVYDEISEKYPDVKFAKVDTEAEQGLARAANITSIPTLMAFRDKVLVFSQPGAMNASQLDDLIVAVKGIDMQHVHAQIAEQEAQAQ